MHKRAYWGCTKRCNWGCTWAAPVIALVDTIIIANGLSNSSSTGGPNSPLENALDGGLNVGLGWIPLISYWKHLKMHNELTKEMHLMFYLMIFALKYEYAHMFEGAPGGLSERQTYISGWS